MKKTNFTSFTSRVGRHMQWVLSGLLVFLVTAVGWAQGPNCSSLNASLNANGEAVFAMSEVVTNCPQTFDLTITNAYGGLVRFDAGAGLVTSATGLTCASIITVPACSYLNAQLKMNVTGATGACWSWLTFKQDNGPVIDPDTWCVWCLDPEVSDWGLYLDRFYGNNDGKYDPADDFKTATIPCFGDEKASFVADWVFPRDCDPGVQDTAKVILREWEAFDKFGNRGVAFDTIIVFVLPQITAENIYCAEKDTTYCGVYTKGGPYMVVYEKDSITGMPTGDCDTLYFLNPATWEPNTFDPKCGIQVHVDKWKFEDICNPQYKVVLDIKQTCYGQPSMACVVTPPAGGPGTPNAFVEVAPGYWTCTYWVTDFDTVPPYAEVKFDKVQEQNILADHCYDTPVKPGGHDIPVILVPTTTHDCAAHTYIPPICVYDDWAGIKQVKAMIPGVGTWIGTKEAEECEFVHDDLAGTKLGDCYAFHQTIKLPKSEYPHRVMYEIYDNCHQIDTIYSYLLVKDLTRPVAVADKGVTVSLASKKVWVYAETFDEGSWDNCGVNLLLARRSDWYEACVDLCDDVEVCAYTEHHDTIWSAILEDDKHVDEIEAHYYKTIEWLKEDGVPCGELIANGWIYDLMKYGTLHCIDHPYEVDHEYFRHLVEQTWGQLSEKFCYPEHPFNCEVAAPADKPIEEGLSEEDRQLLDLAEQIGGGWSDAVPFSCEDACSPVTVEILVMDYWCNWSKAWTDVWVEDKTPISVVKDVEDAEISCKTYKDRRYADPQGGIHPVSIEQIVELAKAGDDDAYDALDEIFGGYCKAWLDPYGNWVDIDGEEIECDIPFSDSSCQCSSWYDLERVYDEHFGYKWDSVYIDSCWYYERPDTLTKGIVIVNCEENVYCEQDVWCEFDHCGQGYLFRKFKIWQGCPPHNGQQAAHIPDTIYRHQRIWVGNNCELEKKMFDKPGDTEVYACGIEYDPDGSGNVVGIAGPENTGYPTLKDVFDNDCRIVGIAHHDKVFKIVGGNYGCYKIVRTWYFSDWCGKKPVEELWWKDRELVEFEWEQKIIVLDTTPPVCTIAGPTEDGGTVEAAGCYYNLDATVTVTDMCGVIEYYWELLDVTKSDDIVTVDYGSGDLNSEESDFFEVSVDDLGPGTYKLKSRVRDECQNESYCDYTVTVVANKKPTPICITSLTAELTPMDLDQDGVVDTAMATIWAYEFDQSSYAPCDESDALLEFYIEFIDGVGDDTLDTEVDLDSLNLGCADIGPNQVRLWVRGEGGTYDYCNVMLMVQNNMGGCGDISNNNSNITGLIRTELDQNVEQVNVKAELEDGSVLNWLTTASGAYNFATALGTKVIVTPTKDVEDINGVSTLDLVKIQKHILGKSLLNTNLREVAADANADGKVSTLDLIEIRKLILGKTDEFSNVDSWRFFDKANSQESYVIDPIENPMVINWTGVKVGDVDMSSDPSRSANRSGKALAFQVNDVKMVAGNTYRVDFKASNFEDITGYQFTMNFDRNALNVVTVESGAISLNDNNFGMNRLSEGIVTTSWNAAEGITVGNEEVLFTVVFEVNDNVSLSDAITLNSRITSAEAYNSADQLYDVSLNFNNGGLNEASFALYQNEPNPFKDVTSIGFSLPEAMAATVTVYDVTGKVIKVVEGEYTKGYNSFTLKKSDINNTGVLYYQLDTEAFTATKKMIVIE